MYTLPHYRVVVHPLCFALVVDSNLSFSPNNGNQTCIDQSPVVFLDFLECRIVCKCFYNYFVL